MRNSEHYTYITKNFDLYRSHNVRTVKSRMFDELDM